MFLRRIHLEVLELKLEEREIKFDKVDTGWTVQQCNKSQWKEKEGTGQEGHK